MRILSLFDGMACGAIAFTLAGIPIDEYHAYEIDKFAIQAATHNFPFIEEHGDVFQADFTQYEEFDYLIGGSPCTYWSIAQSPDKRETVASGMGWDLFSQYTRALKEAKPKYFIYENNKSMANAIRESITQAFGFEPICINSALVSAQNRQRLYWVGKRNDDGTYSKVDVQQPEDRGIMLKDVLDNGIALKEHSPCIDANYFKGGNLSSPEKQSGQRNMVAEPVNMTAEGKAQTVKAQAANTAISNIVAYTSTYGASGVAEPVPMCVAQRGRYIGSDNRSRSDGGPTEQYYECRGEKTNALATVQKDNMVAEPVNTTPKQVGAMPRPNGELSKSQGFRIYDINGKTVTLKGNAGGAGGKTGLYAMPVEFENGIPTKAISRSDGKTYAVYSVSNGIIATKSKKYPIKLQDGYYIIRKLSVSECKRLQTVPDWYDMSCISNSQAYKCLGNGWTCEVIVHLIKATQEGKTEAKQLTFWEV